MMLDTAWEQAATAIETAIAERHALRHVWRERHCDKAFVATESTTPRVRRLLRG